MDFNNTLEVRPLKDFIGQEKAIEALKFGLEIDSPGYNIFVTGFSGTGKSSVIYDYISEIAEERKNRGEVKLRDFCFVYNFENPSNPVCLIFEKGEGQKFKELINNILTTLKEEAPKMVQSSQYFEGLEEIESAASGKIVKLKDDMINRAKKEGFVLYRDDNEIRWWVLPYSRLKNDQKEKALMAEEERDALSAEDKKNLEQKEEQLNKEALQMKRKIALISSKLDKDIKIFEDKMVSNVLNRVFGKIKDYENNPKIAAYLKNLREYSFKEAVIFMGQKSENTNSIALPNTGHDNSFLPFIVNIIVDNSKNDEPPVIIERHPNFSNIFGEIGKKNINGVYSTDHTLIRTGSVLLADGGYWIVDIEDLLRNSPITAWFKLEKTLKERFLKIEDVMEYYGFGSYAVLNPQEIPLNVKAVVVGNPFIYYALIEADEQFLSVFQVKAEFDSEMLLNENSIQNYAGFISLIAGKNQLLPFDKSGVAKIVEYGIRLSDSQKKLSVRFGKIKNIIIESNYWAKKAGSNIVRAADVMEAIGAKKRRLNFYQEHMLEYFKDGVWLVEVDGEKVGQMNGLSIYDFGDYSFGVASRITVKTFLGDGEIISIQKETKMAGSIHNTGLLTLSGYFYGKYGLKKRLNFSASITFEQNYVKTDGDSASMAELVCLISSLADLPINQGIAMTGSVNQNGESQPIGGVNEKIEGFYNICKEKGLTGKQGVIIPKINLSDLMLDEEVVDAVKNNRFCIYAIESVDDAVEILMNKPAGKIHGLVDKKLEEMAKFIKDGYSKNNGFWKRIFNK